MVRPYNVTGYYTIKVPKKEYPWPCKDHPGRTILLFDDDVLTKADDGTFNKHTGLGCIHIRIPNDDVVFHKETARLVLI